MAIEEVDNVQGLLSFRSMFQLISFLRLGRCLCLISANGRFSGNILPGNSDRRIDITQVHNIVVAFYHPGRGPVFNLAFVPVGYRGIVGIEIGPGELQGTHAKKGD